MKAVVSQVPLVDGYENIRSLVRSDFIGGFQDTFNDDRDARYRGEAPVLVPAVNKDPLGPAAMPTPDSYQWFTETHEERAPSWRNEITLRSVEMLREYSPDSIVERISPTPLLLLVAENDVLTPTELALATYQKAREPKKLVMLPGGHFDAYVKGFDASMVPARDWFLEHLKP
ncbi:hypothetical protein [Actinomycetospora sp.]|uniref:hypothetical protein n=1 Tax=Actinomycetospora sp. TaxID=1872135 RepID=UPI002F40D2D0